MRTLDDTGGPAWRWYLAAGLLLLVMLVADVAGLTDVLRP